MKKSKKSLKSYKNQVDQNLESSMERKLEDEHLGSPESTHVPKSFLEIRVSVTCPKSIYPNLEKILEDWKGLSSSSLEQTIGKPLLLLMMEYSKERGMKTMSTSDFVEWDLQESPAVKTSLTTTISD